MNISAVSNPAASATRKHWVALIDRIARLPLQRLAEGRLRATMPVETRPDQAGQRRDCTHLELLGRTLAGIAPWLELNQVSDPEEAAIQARLRELACGAIAQAVDPDSPDCMNFYKGEQPLVDAAFLAHALLRAPQALFAGLSAVTQERLITALKSTRGVTPHFCNWLLFSAMVEAALLRFTGEADFMRMDYAIRQHEQWYKGDGAYGDGPEFHWDYYNSFVIQPMLLDVLEVASGRMEKWRPRLPAIQERARRYAAVLERLVAPDGSFPPIGRSLTYRCGAFQHLAQMALRRDLGGSLCPAAVRCALDAVIRRTLGAPGTFDAEGWLRIGLCGAQSNLAESYISTGSLYLCTTAFLPLGLPASDPFWSAPDALWSSAAIWGGENLPADHVLH